MSVLAAVAPTVHWCGENTERCALTRNEGPQFFGRHSVKLMRVNVLILVHVAPAIGAPVLQPEDCGCHIGERGCTIRNDEWQPVSIEYLGGVVIVTNDALVTSLAVTSRAAGSTLTS